MNGLNVDNISNYRAAVLGLSKEQATLLLSTKGLNQAQIDLILSNEQVTATQIAEAASLDGVNAKKSILTAENQKQLLASKLLTTEKLAEIASTIGLETAENGSLISKKALNAEMVKQQLESLGVVGSAQAQIMSMLGLTTAETGAATASNVLSGAMAKLNIVLATNPIGALITAIGIAIGAIVGATAAYVKWGATLDNTREKLADLKNVYQESTKELTAIKDKIEDNRQKIEEINKNPLDIIDKNTLSTLREENTELERQRILIEKINADDKKKLNDETVALLSRQNYASNYKTTTWNDASVDAFNNGNIWGGIGRSLMQIPTLWMPIKTAKDSVNAFAKSFELIDQIKSNYAELKNLTYGTQEYDDLSANIISTEQELSAIISLFSKQKDNLDASTESGKLFLDAIKGIEIEYVKLDAVKPEFDTFEEIINSDIYGQHTDELVKLAKQGTLTAEILRNDYSTLCILFEALGLNIDDIIQKFKTLEVSSNGSGDDKTSLSWSSEESTKKIDDFQSKLSSLSEALKKLKDGSLTSTDKIDLLQDFPELEGRTEDLDKAIEELIDNSLEKLFELLGDDVPEELKETLTSLAKESKEFAESIDVISGELDNIQSAYKTVQDAMKEYSETGKLSLDTVQALFEMDSQYFGLLIDESGNLSLTTEALKKLTLARIEDMAVSRLKALIDDVATNGEEAESLKYLTSSLDSATNARWKDYYAQIASLPVSEEVKQKIYEQADAYRELANVASQTATTNIDFSMNGVSSRDSGESIADILKEKALNELKYAIDKVKAEIDETADEIDILDDHLELTFEDDFVERIELTSDKLNLVTQHGAELRAEFERLSQIEPTTAAEAQELQSRMEELGQQIQENIQDVRELTLELVQLRVDALTSISKNTLSKFKHEFNIINNSIQAMSGQSLMGMNFSVLPVIPKDVVEQQREINDRLIAEEKRYQEEIWKIRKKYIELDKAEKDKDIAERLSKAGGGSGSGGYSSGAYGTGSGGYTGGYSSNYNTSGSSGSGGNGITPAKKNVERPEITLSEDETSKAGRKIVEVAMEFLGTPYVWGGTTPSGFDCSGLVQYVYKEVGEEISRVTYDQIKDGTPVGKDGLKEGDLVFFGDPSSPHHVGIYAGDGKYIHAPRTGDVVKVSELSGRGDYAGARRIVEAESYNPIKQPEPNGAKTSALSWSAEKLKKTDLTQLPKLTEDQIETVIEKFFTPKNSVVKSSDSKGIYDAQTQSGISALALLGIGALESGYGTSSIAKKKGNLWGWGAVNSNPMGGAKTFADEVGQAAIEYANNLKSLYYDERGAKSIYAIGTGDNPSGLGYAYNDDGSISTTWANDIGSIMKQFIDVAGDTFVVDGSGEDIDKPVQNSKQLTSKEVSNINKNIVKLTDVISKDILDSIQNNKSISTLDASVKIRDYLSDGFRDAIAGEDYSIVNYKTGESLALSGDASLRGNLLNMLGNMSDVNIDDLIIDPKKEGKFVVITKGESDSSYTTFRKSVNDVVLNKTDRTPFSFEFEDRTLGLLLTSRKELADTDIALNRKQDNENKTFTESITKRLDTLFGKIKDGLKETEKSVKETTTNIQSDIEEAVNWADNHPIDIRVNGGDGYFDTSNNGGSSDTPSRNYYQSKSNEYTSSKSSSKSSSSSSSSSYSPSKTVDTPKNIRKAVTDTWSTPKKSTSTSTKSNSSTQNQSFGDKVKSAASAVVNHVKEGAQWFWKKITGHATGTDENGLPDSGVIIGGELGVEGAILPDGTAVEIKKGLTDLPAGTQILTHEQYNEVKKYEGRFRGQKIPKYATGTGVKIPNPNDLLGMPLGEAAKVLADAFKDQYEEIVRNHVSFNSLKGISLANEAEIDSKIKEHVTKTGKSLTVEEMQKMAGELSVGMPSTLGEGTEQDVEKYLADRQKQEAEKAKQQQEYLAKFDMYIQEVVDKAQEFTEEELKHWRELDKRIDPITKKAHSGLDYIRANGGTTEARAYTSNLYKEISSDYYSLMKETMEWQKGNILRSYKEQMDILDKMYEYYDKRATAEDVTADELKILKDGIEEQQNSMKELSDAYIEAADQISEFVINTFKNSQLQYQSINSYMDRNISDAERELNNSTEIVKKNEAYDKLISAHNEKASTGELKKNQAHEARVKWQEAFLDPDTTKNPQYEQYKKIFDTVDFEALFDANGDFTKDVDNILKAYQDDFNVDSTLLRNLLNEMQVYKQSFFEGLNEMIEAEDASLEATRNQQDLKVSLWIDYLERQAEIYDFIYNREQAIIDSTKSEYELRQQIRQSISDANNTLEANKELEQWLDPETRKLLFNDEDYSKVIEEYESIQKAIESDAAAYQAQIEALTEDEWYKEEQITAAYQAQLEAHRESLEVATKELEVSKKRLEYENRAKERDTQIILGNRVVNVADPEAMHNLAREKVQLESDYDNTLKTHAENQEIRDKQELNNETKAQSAALQANADMWNDMTDEQRRALSKNLPLVEEITSALSSLTTLDPKQIRDFAYNAVRDSFLDLRSRDDIGYGTDITQDYSALENLVKTMTERGVISKSYGEELLKHIDDARESKRAVDHDFFKYFSMYNGGRIREQDIYMTDEEVDSTQDLYLKRYGEADDYQNRINKILEDAKGREFFPSELEELKRLETKRNRKIYEDGLSYAQTTYYGAPEFSDWIDGDYSASIDKMEKRIALAGRKATETEIKQLRLWEKHRNAKIDNDGLPYEKTYKYNFGAPVNLDIPADGGFILDGVKFQTTKDFNSNEYTTDKIASGELVPLAPWGYMQKGTATIESNGTIVVNDATIEGAVRGSAEYPIFPIDILPFNLENAGTTMFQPGLVAGTSPFLRSINDTVTNYNFGDIIITEPVNNANDVMNAFVKQFSNKVETTNNMSHN